MAVVIGVDLGTTKITALALDLADGEVRACHTAANQARVAAAAGHSEWDSERIAATGCECLRGVAEQLARRHEVVGLGLTGQQHGVVIVDEQLAPRTPFINWQDRRGEDRYPGTAQTYVERAVELAGADAPGRTGCRLATGYLAITLFWLKTQAALPTGTACFVTDYFAARLTGQTPVTDPTSAAGGGILDITRDVWDEQLLAALGLSRGSFPPVVRSGERLGTLTAAAAAATGLPAGLPVFVGIGDNQASFLGSVAERSATVLVNVGTGGQVAAYSDRFLFDPLLETRPFPRGGYLLVSAGLCGGASYAALEQFYRAVGTQLFGAADVGALYPLMNQLAADVSPGAGGLRCEPFFSGTRAQPELRGTWSGVSVENFTPAHMTRALLEGMARAFRRGYEQIAGNAQLAPRRLVGAGNGLRENAVLAQLVSEAFALPMRFPLRREEAAYGAALLGAVGAGAFPDLAAAGRLIRYGGTAA